MPLFLVPASTCIPQKEPVKEVSSHHSILSGLQIAGQGRRREGSDWEGQEAALFPNNPQTVSCQLPLLYAIKKFFLQSNVTAAHHRALGGGRSPTPTQPLKFPSLFLGSCLHLFSVPSNSSMRLSSFSCSTTDRPCGQNLHHPGPGGRLDPKTYRYPLILVCDSSLSVQGDWNSHRSRQQ